MVDRESVFQPGDLCDKYRIVALLATGGQAEVYRAQHEVMEREVALKVVRAPLADRDDVRQRLKQEAKLLGRIQHPGIVTVYDAGITPAGVIYIAMELLGGQTLHHALRAVRKVPVPQALQICASIGDALEAAHEIGIVHRDVKPANVFVTGKNDVKIVDLGTAKLFHAGLKTSRADAVVGTLWYMAPEQVLKNSGIPQSDIYAVGLVLYEMIAGRHAFADEDSETTATKFQIGMRQLYESPRALTDLIPGFPSYVWDLIEKATQKAPEDRFGSMLEFATEARNQRRRFVEEVKALGIVPGAVDLTQQPPPEASPASHETATTTVDTAVPAGFVTEPLDPALVASLTTPVHEHVGVPAIESPTPPAEPPVPIAPAPVLPVTPIRIVSVSAEPSVGESGAAERSAPESALRAETSTAETPAASPDPPAAARVSLFDDKIHQRDFNSGMHVIASLPDADSVRKAMAVLGARVGPDATFAVGAAIAAIPRAYGAYALALSRAIVDLAEGHGTVQRTAAEFVLEAVRGYMPHCRELIPADLVIPEVSNLDQEIAPRRGGENRASTNVIVVPAEPHHVNDAVGEQAAVVSHRSRHGVAVSAKHVIAIGAVLGVAIGVTWVLLRGRPTEAKTAETSSSVTTTRAASSVPATVAPAPEVALATSAPLSAAPALQSSVPAAPDAPTATTRAPAPTAPASRQPSDRKASTEGPRPTAPASKALPSSGL